MNAPLATNVYWSGMPGFELPPGVTTVISTVPAAIAGVYTSMMVVPICSKHPAEPEQGNALLAGMSTADPPVPKTTSVAPKPWLGSPKLAPTTVKYASPAVAPYFGETVRTLGVVAT